jgi:PAS domain S-box-containing protein
MQWLDHEYLSRLLESCPEIVVAVDKAGTIVYYNEGARQTLHYSAQEVLSRNVVGTLYPSVEEARRVMQAMVEPPAYGRICDFETVLCTKEGDRIPVTFSGSLLRDEQGAVVGSIGFARDLREMRRREQSATTCEIAVSVAHEVNNPLEVIANNLELIQRSLQIRYGDLRADNNHGRFEAIRAAVDRVKAIVHRLDEMARDDTYETRPYLHDQLMTDLRPRLSGDEEIAEPRQWSEHYFPLAGMAVLVVDDDLSVVASLADLLRAEHCQVYAACRPSDALRLVRDIEQLDLVISDVVMDEMDGCELYRRVKTQRPELPVILTTAYYYDRDHVIKRSRLAGLEHAIFKKPINPARLRELMLKARQQSTLSVPAQPMEQAAKPAG